VLTDNDKGVTKMIVEQIKAKAKPGVIIPKPEAPGARKPNHVELVPRWINPRLAGEPAVQLKRRRRLPASGAQLGLCPGQVCEANPDVEIVGASCRHVSHGRDRADGGVRNASQHRIRGRPPCHHWTFPLHQMGHITAGTRAGSSAKNCQERSSRLPDGRRRPDGSLARGITRDAERKRLLEESLDFRNVGRRQSPSRDLLEGRTWGPGREFVPRAVGPLAHDQAVSLQPAHDPLGARERDPVERCEIG